MTNLRYGSSFIISSLLYGALTYTLLSFLKTHKTPPKKPSNNRIKIAIIAPKPKVLVPPKKIVKPKPKPKKVIKKSKPKPKPKPKRIVQKVIKKVKPKQMVKKNKPIIEEPYFAPTPIIREEPYLAPEPIIREEPYLAPEPVIREEPYLTPEPIIREEPYLAPEPIIREEPYLTPEPIIREEKYSSPPIPVREKRYYQPVPVPVPVPRRVVQYAEPQIMQTPIAPQPVREQKADKSTEKRAFLRRVRTQIMSNKKYPKMALRRHIEGSVDIMFDIASDGSVSNIRFLNGKSILQKSVREALIHSFPINIPSELNSEFPMYNISVTINFNIR